MCFPFLFFFFFFFVFPYTKSGVWMDKCVQRTSVEKKEVKYINNFHKKHLHLKKTSSNPEEGTVNTVIFTNIYVLSVSKWRNDQENNEFISYEWMKKKKRKNFGAYWPIKYVCFKPSKPYSKLLFYEIYFSNFLHA